MTIGIQMSEVVSCQGKKRKPQSVGFVPHVQNMKIVFLGRILPYLGILFTIQETSRVGSTEQQLYRLAGGCFDGLKFLVEHIQGFPVHFDQRVV